MMTPIIPHGAQVTPSLQAQVVNSQWTDGITGQSERYNSTTQEGTEASLSLMPTWMMSVQETFWDSLKPMSAGHQEPSSSLIKTPQI